MSNLHIRSTALRGLSFGIPDLLLIGSWSEACGLQMAVRLDHGSDTEEFEEVLTFHTEAGRPCRFIMWRDENAVYVQPLIGRVRPYGSVVEALSCSEPQRFIVLTDVMATGWPEEGGEVGRGD